MDDDTAVSQESQNSVELTTSTSTAPGPITEQALSAAITEVYNQELLQPQNSAANSNIPQSDTVKGLPPKSPSEDVAENKEHLPLIVLLTTGGTIAGVAPIQDVSTSYTSGVLTPAELQALVPGLERVARIEAHAIASIDSKDMTFQIWVKLVENINKVLKREEVKGVVITHGTDTLEETAYFLHLTVCNTKPIVLTAAMRPSNALSADGPRNLYEAVVVACARLSDSQGVLVVMNNAIHSARYVSKKHSNVVHSFESPEAGQVGSVHDTRVEFYSSIKPLHTIKSRFAQEGNKPVLSSKLPWVEIVMSYTSPTPLLIDALVEKKVNGIVIAGTGEGTIHCNLQKALEMAVEKKVVIVRATRLYTGHVTHNGAMEDDRLHFLTAGLLAPWKARILLMLILAYNITDDRDRQEIFDTY